jgi:hypothetical protein
MDMSQSEFAIKVLDISTMTVARWETCAPPHEDRLIRLMEVALTQISQCSHEKAVDFANIAHQFRQLWGREIAERFGASTALKMADAITAAALGAVGL